MLFFLVISYKKGARMHEQYKKNPSYSSGFSFHSSVSFVHKALRDIFFNYYFILVLCCLLALVFRWQWKKGFFFNFEGCFWGALPTRRSPFATFTPQHFLQQGIHPLGWNSLSRIHLFLQKMHWRVKQIKNTIANLLLRFLILVAKQALWKKK